MSRGVRRRRGRRGTGRLRGGIWSGAWLWGGFWWGWGERWGGGGSRLPFCGVVVVGWVWVVWCGLVGLCEEWQ